MLGVGASQRIGIKQMKLIASPNAKHQQIHPQYALLSAIPESRTSHGNVSQESVPGYGVGDLVTEFISTYRGQTGHGFFQNYQAALRSNEHLPG